MASRVPRCGQLCKTLGAVDEEAAARGEPELAVLVVRQSDGLPGQGWWVSGGGRRMAMKGRGRVRKRRASSVSFSRRPSTFGQWRRRTLPAKGRRWPSLPAIMCGRSPSARTMTASASTAGSSGILPDISFNTVSRWARTGQLRVDGKRATPGDRLETGQMPARPAGRGRARRRARRAAEADRRAADRGRSGVRPGHGAGQGPRLDHAQQAAWPGDAGRDQDGPAPRPPARRPGRR